MGLAETDAKTVKGLNREELAEARQLHPALAHAPIRCSRWRTTPNES